MSNAPAPPVVLNTTPLVALWVLGRLDLLRDLFGQVVIPPAVQSEFMAAETQARQDALAQAPWVAPQTLAHPERALAYPQLDRGEAEVLALAVETEARLVIIDERLGRRYAQRLQLPLTGTLGVLLLAKEKGLLPALHPEIERLQQAGLSLGPDLITEALHLARET